jgi:enterochelin esterase-like enzyme
LKALLYPLVEGFWQSMAKKIQSARQGALVHLDFDSKILQSNPLKDPSSRSFPVYLPHAYDQSNRSKRRFTVLYDLVGFTGSGPSHTNWRNFEENVPEKLDRLIESGTMPPCIVVFPDCFTALGGNQYINSSAIGRYADYLTKEIVPFIDRTFRTKADRAHRGCFGKSSGGYGAIVHAMKYPDTWGAVANHSGDAYFDFVYQASWPETLTTLQRYALSGRKSPPKEKSAKPGFDDGRIARFLADVHAREALAGSDIMALMMICMAATYDPDPGAPLGFRVPYDLNTGVKLEQRWAKWLRHDPIHMVREYRDNLKTSRGIYIDCGWRDQFHIHFGTRQLASVLNRHKITHRYLEFDGTHSGVDHRMDKSLPFLAKALR